MKIQKILFTGACLFLVIFLFYVNVGLNISGPKHYHDMSFEVIQKTIQKEYPQIQSIKRHSFKYITYSSVVKDKAYFFNNEGELIVEKDYLESNIEQVKKIAVSVGFKDFDVTLGYGYHNPVYVIEDDGNFLYLDYDSLENVFYLKGE